MAGREGLTTSFVTNASSAPRLVMATHWPFKVSGLVKAVKVAERFRTNGSLTANEAAPAYCGQLDAYQHSTGAKAALLVLMASGTVLRA